MPLTLFLKELLLDQDSRSWNFKNKKIFMVLVVLLLVNLGVSIYVAVKVRRAEAGEEEDYARPKLTTPSPQTTRPTTSAPGIGGRAGNVIH